MVTKQFGRLNNGVLIYAPKPLIINNAQVFTNKASIYLQEGYKLIVYGGTGDWNETATTIFRESSD